MIALEAFGYSTSPRFFRPEDIGNLPAGELTFALRQALIECTEMGSSTAFRGAYVLQNEAKAPAVPVVYLIETESEAVARQIHRFVWNQNLVPFLIVESPTTVRLYPGFSYERETDQPLIETTNEQSAILEKLGDFAADAIDRGSVWMNWSHAVEPSRRVDERLLRDLKNLDKHLQSTDGLPRTTSHGLIGKYVYLRYLKDREILSADRLEKWELTNDELFTRKATLKAFRKVNAELQEWLNGSVFSLGEETLKDLKAQQLRSVAGVFFGDSPDGQQALFDVYDFSHIPIETLSCVYEQFLHDAHDDDGESRGAKLGAYYTPLPLTDYVVSELDRQLPLKEGMTVLDPACGSGAFLVQCYRRLIERRRRQERRDLRATELREILQSSIFGIDRDDDACRVTELSLILTLLDYVSPPDLLNTTFKLPCLRDQNIFCGDFFESVGSAHAFLQQRRFDWIVANPPWSEVKGTPSPEHEHHAAFAWMSEHQKTHPTTGNQIAEAFLWKAGDHLTSNGVAGMVVLAMTWFKKEGHAFRSKFFADRQVWCLANFANLAYVLFAGRSERPASVVFFQPTPPSPDHTILSFAPFVAEQVANRPEKPGKRQTTWNIVVSSQELKEVENASAVTGDSLTWKLAMWGTNRDRKFLERLNQKFPGLDSIENRDTFSLHQGLELRTKRDLDNEPLEHHPELAEKKRLNISALRNARDVFSFPNAALSAIPSTECYVRKGRAELPIKVSTPPHVIVDASRRFAVFSNEFIAVPARQIGISGRSESESRLRALSVYLSSMLVRYHQFFYSPKWGVDESLSDLDTLKKLPIPDELFSDANLKQLETLQRSLAHNSEWRFDEPQYRDQADQKLRSLTLQLNDAVFKIAGLRKTERWIVEDFVNLHLELNKGKVTPSTVRAPDTDEVKLYLSSLQECLDNFLTADRGFSHRIEALVDRDSAMLSVGVVKSKDRAPPVVLVANDQASRSLRTIRDRLQSKQGQWIYFDRSLKMYSRGTLYQFKPMQRLHWTRRQAVIDADDIIAETLAEGAKS